MCSVKKFSRKKDVYDLRNCSKYDKVYVYVQYARKRSKKMKKLKDFLYDKNDIVIVIIIVAAAAILIFSRIDAIMDYPAKYAEEHAATETKETVKITEPSTEEETVAEDATITIGDEDSSSDVSDKLYEAGLIDSADDFNVFIEDSGKSGSIQSGTFQIPSDSSYEEILDIIT